MTEYVYGDNNGTTIDLTDPENDIVKAVVDSHVLYNASKDSTPVQCTCGAILEDHAEGRDHLVQMIKEGNSRVEKQRTHWDPRIEVSAVAHTVQVGVVPASASSTNDQGYWNPEDGQFLALSRNGINRLIRILRAARVEVYGEDV